MNKLLRAFIKRDLNKARELIKQGENLTEPYNDNGWTPFLFKDYEKIYFKYRFIDLKIYCIITNISKSMN